MCDGSSGKHRRDKSTNTTKSGKERLSGSRLARGLKHAGLPLDQVVIDQLVAAFSTSAGKGLRLSYADFHRMVHCDGLLAGSSAVLEAGGVGGYAGRPGTLDEQVMGRSAVLALMQKHG